MPKYELCLLDIDYTLEEKKPVIRIFGRTNEGKSIVVLDRNVEPYFFALCTDLKGVEKRLKELKETEFMIENVGQTELFHKNEKTKLLKIFTRVPGEVPAAREYVKRMKGVEEVFEADILFNRRYLINNSLEAMSMITVEGEPVERKALQADIVIEAKTKPKKSEGKMPKLNVMAFDIEVHNPEGAPRVDNDPIIMLSAAIDKKKKLFTYKSAEGLPAYVEMVDGEKGISPAFSEYVRENDADILVGYNTDQFDMPYLRDRGELLKCRLKIGRGDGKISYKSKGRYHAAQMKGRVHVDLFHYVTYILRGALRQVSKRTLENVAKVFLKDYRKMPLDWRNICEYWDNGKKDLLTLFDYSVTDSVVTLKLAEKFLPQIYEIAKLVRIPLFDASRMTYGQLVESYLMWNAFERGELIPNRPGAETKEVRRDFDAFKGAFVLEPKKGMHENVALFDFRSLYPTIIISHNIDPSTVNCDCCKGKAKKVEDTGNWFCEKKTGLIPDVLKRVIETRIELKKRMKQVDEESDEYNELDNKQYALKILANSTYGYMGYMSARWYSRDCARSVTALGRMYIQNIAKIAEDFGLEPIYGDTDSLFVVSKEGKISGKVKPFMKKVNSELPGIMELEFEGVYKRGVFVTKKRYALIDEKDRLKIRGLEFVRKDWSPLAKETQRRVLETLLKEGDADKALDIVKKVVKRVKNGQVEMEDLVIYTELTRPIEKYEVTAPHIAAAKRLRDKGKDIHTGSSIGYIIVKGGSKRVSDRAMPVEYVKFKNYDAAYYIGHQIIPAISRVMEALGYKEEDLLGQKQFKLTEFTK